MSNWIAIVLASMVCICSMTSSVCSSLLRDESLAARAPFSLARTQLLWWSTIIAVCMLVHFAHRGALPRINPTCLAIFSISAATSALAAIIESGQRRCASRTQGRLHQDEASHGFLLDVLCDRRGLSVHRFQAVSFNVIYGISFVLLYLDTGFQLPTLDPWTLTLLGLSNCAYLVLKAYEHGGRWRVHVLYHKRGTRL